MTKRNSAIAIGAWAAATGFACAVSTRRRRASADVTAYRARTARTATVRCDRESLYRLWTDPAAFPRFFRGIEAIEPLEDGRQRWTIAGTDDPVEVSIVDDTPGERVEWRASRLGAYGAQGFVSFVDAGVRGTEVRLALALAGPMAKTTTAFARLFGASPPQIAAETLRRFKALAETGEIPQAVRN